MRTVTASGLATALPRVMAGGAIWAAFIAAMVLHAYARGAADNIGGEAYSPAGLEQLLFHGVPSVWLQRWLSTEALPLTWTAVAFHASWFYVPILLAILVQVRLGSRALAQLLALHVALLFACDAVYAIAPASPPWMQFDLVRVVDVAYGDTSGVDANAVAALPSLHVAVPVLYAVWFARRSETPLRRLSPLLALWTLGVSWSVVYGGEHYVIDAAAGAAVAVAVYAACTTAATRAARLIGGTSAPVNPLIVEEQRRAA